jgi:hypothetical protein
VNRARRETLAMAGQGDVAVQMEYGAQDRRVNYELGVGTGADRRAVPVRNAQLMSKPVATKTRARPYAYILPRDAVDAVAMLQRHGITVEQLQDSARIEVQAYTVADVAHAPEYNHAATTRVTVGDVITTTRTFPRGTYIVPTGQVLGRVVAHMLEPETDDNVIYWNTMDAWLPRPRTAPPAPAAADDEDAPRPGAQQGAPLVPIFKLMRPMPLPVKIIE